MPQKVSQRLFGGVVSAGVGGGVVSGVAAAGVVTTGVGGGEALL